jgi:hypothetical protein
VALSIINPAQRRTPGFWFVRGRRTGDAPPRRRRTLFALGSAALNNRPIKTRADADTPALRALTFFIRTPQGLNRICRNVRAPRAARWIRVDWRQLAGLADLELFGISRLTMRLSDAGLRRRQTKLIYPNHRPHSVAHRRRDPRDRSNRLLDCRATPRRSRRGTALTILLPRSCGAQRTHAAAPISDKRSVLGLG